MKNNSLITIIVPIYKVEEYLDRCVESIVNQTYKNIEIILVDDGSPDNCGIKCDEWARKDKRIKSLHKKNGGLSDARNFGKKFSHGDYITFIDSDDWVKPSYVEILYNSIVKDNSDISMCWFKKTNEYKYDNTISKNLKKYCCMNSKECIRDLLYQKKTDTCAWGKLYSKKVFNLLNYPVGKLYEDIPVTFAVINASIKIARIENEEYYYFQRSNSIQNMKFNTKKLDAIIHIKDMINKIEDNYPDLSDACKCRYFSVLSNILFQIDNQKCNKDIILKIWSEMKKIRKNILFNKLARKKARIASFLSYGGYNFLKFIYKNFNE